MWFFVYKMRIYTPFCPFTTDKPRAQHECHSEAGLSSRAQPRDQRALAQEQLQFSFKNHKKKIINKVINHNLPPYTHTPISVIFPQVFS